MCKFYQPVGVWALPTITLDGDNEAGVDNGVPMTLLEMFP